MTRGRAKGLDAVVVGAGLMGRWHAYEIARVGGRVVAVVDPDLERARRLADRAGPAAAVADLDELPDLDDPGHLAAEAGGTVVHVCTPPGTHEPLVERALRGGRHVLVEKPLAGDAAVTERLLGEARDRGLLLGPVHQLPFQPGVRKLLGERDRLGDVLHLIGEARSAGAEGRSDADRDRIALEILPHFLSLAHRFLPYGLAGIRWRTSRPRAGELSAEGEVGGVGVHLLVSMGGRPPANQWTVIGTHATGRADLFHGHAVIEPGGTSRAWKAARPFALAGVEFAGASANLLKRGVGRQPAYPGLRELIRAFHAAAAEGGAAEGAAAAGGGSEGPVAEAEILAVARALDRIAEQR